jgi:hypothetical protein
VDDWILVVRVLLAMYDFGDIDGLLDVGQVGHAQSAVPTIRIHAHHALEGACASGIVFVQWLPVAMVSAGAKERTHVTVVLCAWTQFYRRSIPLGNFKNLAKLPSRAFWVATQF